MKTVDQFKSLILTNHPDCPYTRVRNHVFCDPKGERILRQYLLDLNDEGEYPDLEFSNADDELYVVTRHGGEIHFFDVVAGVEVDRNSRQKNQD